MIKLNIKYSIEYEVQRIIETIKKIDWYRENKYKVLIPENILLCLSDKSLPLSEEEIRKIVESEFNSDIYQTQSDFLKNNWEKINYEIKDELEKTDLKFEDVYEINLTKYGVGGSYHYPNIVIINILNSFNMGMLRTVLHEIIHLSVHKWITENNIQHWEKERIVDLLILKIIPRISKSQQLKIDTTKVDKIFEENYPNIKNTIEKLGK